jgi:putative intracellular protease/amidase
MTRTVGMIVTSTSDIPGRARTGLWLEELAAPYWVLDAAGLAIEILAPVGGRTPIDAASVEEPWISAAGRRFLDDAEAMSRLANARAIGDASAADYVALFIVGGVGAAFDLHANTALTGLLEAAIGRSAPVAAVCTGAIALASLSDGQGEALIRGRSLTGISNAENEALGLLSLLPALTEDSLLARGALYRAAEPWAANVVVDGLLLTGQNPASAGPLAERTLDALRWTAS